MPLRDFAFASPNRCSCNSKEYGVGERGLAVVGEGDMVNVSVRLVLGISLEERLSPISLSLRPVGPTRSDENKKTGSVLQLTGLPFAANGVQVGVKADEEELLWVCV